MTPTAYFARNPLDAANPPCYIGPQFRRSSAVEQLTVNQLVVGSIPTAGANFQVMTGNRQAADKEIAPGQICKNRLTEVFMRPAHQFVPLRGRHV